MTPRPRGFGGAFAYAKSFALISFLACATAQSATTPPATIVLSVNPTSGYPLSFRIDLAPPFPAYNVGARTRPALGWEANPSNGRLQLRGRFVENVVIGQPEPCGPLPPTPCTSDVVAVVRQTVSDLTIGPYPAGTYAIEVFNPGITTNTPDASHGTLTFTIDGVVTRTTRIAQFNP